MFRKKYTLHYFFEKTYSVKLYSAIHWCLVRLVNAVFRDGFSSNADGRRATVFCYFSLADCWLFSFLNCRRRIQTCFVPFLLAFPAKTLNWWLPIFSKFSLGFPSFHDSGQELWYTPTSFFDFSFRIKGSQNYLEDLGKNSQHVFFFFLLNTIFWLQTSCNSYLSAWCFKFSMLPNDWVRIRLLSG